MEPPRLPRLPVALEPDGTLAELPQPGRTLVEPYVEPGGRLVERWVDPQPSQNLVKPWWNPRGTLPQTTPAHTAALLTSNRPGPPRSLCRMWRNPRGTLPQTTPDHPAALAEPGGTLVEPSWNLTSNHPEPSRSSRRTWWNPRRTLPQTTPDHPAAWWNPRGTLPQTALVWNPGKSGTPAALAEPGGTCGTLVETYLRAAPDHPGAYLG